MQLQDTPLERYAMISGREVWVKREDLCCPAGPHFSKMRGVARHVATIAAPLVGVLDTFHSKAGWAVASACRAYGKQCWNYYPEYKNDPGFRFPQERARELGATLRGLPAGRSCILWHRAKKQVEAAGGYMMPNGLKLPESLEETAAQAERTQWPQGITDIVVSASSGTIAKGVVCGLRRLGPVGATVHIHLGHSRSTEALRSELFKIAPEAVVRIIDQGYAYKDKARPGHTPLFPCNQYYDLKAWRWMSTVSWPANSQLLFWNIGG